MAHNNHVNLATYNRFIECAECGAVGGYILNGEPLCPKHYGEALRDLADEADPTPPENRSNDDGKHHPRSNL